MQIPVTNEVCLSEIRVLDKADCVKWINNKEIADRTLRIPHPYTEADFENWLEKVDAIRKEHGGPLQFAIRRDGSLIGCIGFGDLIKGHRAEVGYWLARPLWGQGIMTNVIGAACNFAMAEWKLVRITAHVFLFNAASARVLEKNGFQCEGVLRKHHQKNGQFVDTALYALLKP